MLIPRKTMLEWVRANFPNAKSDLDGALEALAAERYLNNNQVKMIRELRAKLEKFQQLS